MSLQFFVADDGSDGQELWVTDGTVAGTFLLKDINPGLGSANIGNLVQSNGIMYFTAYDGSSYHLWRSDGTTAGTYALSSSSNGDNAGNLVNVNGRLFFTGSDSVHGSGLFMTDGTTGGTQFVAAVSSPSQFTAVGNSLFFVAYDATDGYELWKSDGTAAGTAMVKDVLPGAGYGSYGNFTALGGKLYFTADDGTHGSEVWVSDGTAAGTFQLKDINLGASGSSAGNFVAAAGHVFFTANDGAHGTQLWATDGTSAGTVMLSSTLPYSGTSVVFNHVFYYVANDPSGGSAIYTSNGTGITKLDHLGSFSGNFFNLGSTLMFYGDDGTHGSGLYTFDGTNVAFVSSVSGGFSQPVVSNGQLFFISNDGSHGNELWVSDGTAAGTHMTADINPGVYDASIGNISAVGGGVAFTAYRPDVGTELFFSDGTAAGTGLLSNVNPTGNHSPSLSFGAPVQAGALGYFAASDGVNGNELWVTDGTPGGSRMVTDLVFGGSGSNPQNFYAVGTTIFFTADDGVHARQLYTSDGTTVTRLTSNDLDAPYNDGARFFTLGGKFYYLGYDSSANGGGYALFSSDGTVAGTQRVYHFVGGNSYNLPIHLGAAVVFYANDGTNGSGIYSFDGTTVSFVASVNDYENVTVSGNRLFWRSNDGGHGYELWTSDGTSAGTHVVKDINPGPYDSYPNNIVSLGNGSVVFTASNPDTGNEVYVSDGTSAGTMLLQDVNATGNHGQYLNLNSGLATAGSLTFFAGEDGIHGNELWVSDATTGGSHMVADLVVGGSGSNPQNFFVAGGKIFFTADDGVNGRQLYTSDGTTVTKLTSNDLDTPYNDGARFFTLGGKFYYLGYDSSANGGGYALFSSDGTVAGTQRVYHFVGGNSYNVPVHLGSEVVFYANDGTNGSGLYAFDGTTVSFIANVNDYENVTVSGTNLFWRSNDGGHGSELWVTDGTAAGTHLVKDINPGSYDSSPGNIVSLGNGSVVFTAFNPDTGNEVYVSDGTSAGTMLLQDVNATGNHGQYLNLNSGLATAGSLTFFAGEDGIHGNELWVSDATTGGSHMVADMVVGGSSSNPQNFFAAGGKIFFTADDGVNGRQLYTSDGTTVTKLTSNDLDTPYNDGGRFFTLGGKFYYLGYDSSANGGGYALFSSDGTVAGTQRIHHFTGAYSTPIHLGTGMVLYGDDGISGTGLYSFDGTSVGFIASVSDYEDVVTSGSRLFWRSYDGGNGYELWTSDGTTAGTQLVQDSNPGGNSAYPDQITSLGNGSIVYTADDGTHGREIWVSNGTSAGTFMLGDLFPDATGSNPGSLIQVGSQVFFTANYFSTIDGAHGTELFVTDGTSAGTHMVRDINPGSGGTSFGDFFAFGGKLYFAAYDPNNGGWHTYVTDGTDAGTHAMVPGDGSSTGGAGNFIRADATHFYFTGDSGLFYSDG
ncbi:MAG: ELWxxDGT repeat protein, partial [Sphingomonas sp.]|uniref:ELWxxDGT repeat protein n=1 Tax=Sphingomonas sp. TaxID=28214 RepID=UPI003F7D8CDE